MKFEFTGKVVIPKDEERFFRKWSNGNNEYAIINFGVNAGTSTGFVELFGMKSEYVYLRGSNKIEKIRWEDRNDEAVKNTYRESNRIYTNDKVTKLMCTYDMIIELAGIIASMKGENICVTGTVHTDVYVNKNNEGKTIDKYIIENVTIKDNLKKPALNLYTEIIYNKDGVINALKEDKKLYVNGYISQYYSSNSPSAKYIKMIESAKDNKGQRVYIPKTFILDASKILLNNISKEDETIMEKNNNILKHYVSSINKAKSSRKMYHSFWKCKLINGAEEIEFDEAQLTEAQSEQIKLGLATLDDFRPKVIYGERKNEIRLIQELLIHEYANGAVEYGVSIEEFDKSILQYEIPSSLDEIMKEDKKENGSDNMSFDDIEEVESLFN